MVASLELEGAFAILGAGRAGQPVVMDLGKAPRQDVVEEAVDEFLGWYTHTWQSCWVRLSR